MREMRVWYLDAEDPLEEEMATHSGILAWKIPGTEEPGGLQSMGSQRLGHSWVTQNRRGIHGLANLHSEAEACSGVSDDMGGGVWRDEQ